MREKTQVRILNFINDFIKTNGYSPTIREIGEAVGLKSTATVHGHIERLVAKGKLTKELTFPRTTRTTSSVVELHVEKGVSNLYAHLDRVLIDSNVEAFHVVHIEYQLSLVAILAVYCMQANELLNKPQLESANNEETSYS